jgi:hypothetical protein
MSERSELHPAGIELLVWASDDYSEAFVLRDILRRLSGDLSPKAEKDAALAIIGELLERGLIRVGDMNTDTEGLAYWELSVSETLSKLNSLWDIAHPPTMGNGPWFDATESGRRTGSDNPRPGA